MELVYFLLGSNLGDRNMLLKEARGLLNESVGKEIRSSSVFETESWGVADLPDYLNQVIEMETSLEPEAVLEKTQAIEEKLHRERTKKWDSRTMDIDILFFGERIINSPDLKIPHPELHKRLFTLAPLEELVPDFVHPILNKTIQQLKQDVDDGLLVKKYTATN
jgi:2-amino-4-hydroxy-6-hydroxymethyldihydropteridine diphosphokinase